jgi:hypothetical protein
MSMPARSDINGLFLNGLFLLVLLGAATAAEAQVQPELARRYFEDATKLRERDAGHPAGGRLERHAELRVGGAAGGATRLICDRSRELVRVAIGRGSLMIWCWRDA